MEAPKPFLITDSYQTAETILQMDYGRSIREFRVITRENDLMGIEGEVYAMDFQIRSDSAYALWNRLYQRERDGRITRLGHPPRATQRELRPRPTRR